MLSNTQINMILLIIVTDLKYKAIRIGKMKNNTSKY